MVSLSSDPRAEKQIRALVDQLARYNVPRDIRDKLSQYVDSADDQELYQANPHLIAEKLGLDSYTTLSILAYAVQEGLFTLNWQVHCPHHGQLRTFSTLQDGQAREYCPLCQASFDAHLDDEIHVTFTISETVRQLTTPESLADDPHPPTYGLELLNVQAFRDFFADQTLPPGESLQVGRVAFLFTDLLGSTALYAREGDPRAYSWVRDHFEVLFQAAERNRGVTVKTIGDAVMASFLTPGDALRTAVEAYRDLAALNRQLGLSGDAALRIRLGTHVGPCISVTLNNRLDYFGATVNIASRVSHLSQGDDIVLTNDVLADPEVQAQAPQYGELSRFEAALHGYDQHFQLRRLRLLD